VFVNPGVLNRVLVGSEQRIVLFFAIINTALAFGTAETMELWNFFAGEVIRLLR
jgi:hypothetical protein